MTEIRKPRTHLLGVSCQDKVEEVFLELCHQSVRHLSKYKEDRKLKFMVGDQLLIFEWMGKPRHSKWGRRMYRTVKETILILVYDECYIIDPDTEHDIVKWTFTRADELARLDGLKPPTGVRMIETLMVLHPDLDFSIAGGGQYFQVVRW